MVGALVDCIVEWAVTNGFVPTCIEEGTKMSPR